MTLNGHKRTAAVLIVPAAIAAITAAVVLLFSAGHTQPAQAAQAAPMAPGAMTAKAAAFSSAMDRLWEDHIEWTRQVIVDFAAGLPDLKVAETRLLRNQADIGNAVKPYYGKTAGNQLTKLLRTHILEAVPVLAAAKAGDNAKLNRALKAWYANGHQIAVFLSKANPHNWPLGMMTGMMQAHLGVTTNEAVARLQGRWNADARAYDQVHDEILQMSSMLSNGIIRQFPGRFE